MIQYVVDNINSLSPDLLSFVAQFLIHNKDFTQAYEILSKIIDSTDDMKIKAGYLSSLAEKDIKAASEFFQSIDFKIPELENEREVNEIIEASLSKDRKKNDAKKREKKLADKMEETKRGGKIFIPKAKTKKKIKYPKNFDPENPGPMPDPERWLPKWQRSKGKKKLRLKGPQGDVQNIGMHNKKGVSTANMEAASSGAGKRKK